VLYFVIFLGPKEVKYLPSNGLKNKLLRILNMDALKSDILMSAGFGCFVYLLLLFEKLTNK